MSLLTIIQNVCAEISIDQPAAVMSSADPKIIQLRVLSYRAGYALARDHDWSFLVTPTSFAATGVIPEPAQPRQTSSGSKTMRRSGTIRASCPSTAP